MSQTADQVIVELIARMDRYEANMKRAENVSSRTFGKIDRDANRMGISIGRMMGGLAATFSVKALTEMTSSWIDLTSRVDLAAGSMERGGAVMERLQQIARRTYSSLSQTAESWLQNSTSLRELGYSTQQQLDLTEALNNALVISGAKSQVAASVMDAWSKAMALGELRGENLNTVIQRGGRLAEALAKSMGVSTNELRRLGQEGKITTREMFGVTSELEQLRQEADAMPATLTDGLMRIGDAIWSFVGQADKAIGTNEALGQSFVALANSIEDSTKTDWFADSTKWIGGRLSSMNEETANEVNTLLGILDQLRTGIERTMDGSIVDDFERALSDLDGSSLQELRNMTQGLYDDFAEVISLVANEFFVDNEPLLRAVQEIQTEVVLLGGDASEAQEKIVALMQQNPDAAPLLGRLWAVLETLHQLRDGGIAAMHAINDALDAGSTSRGGPLSRGRPQNPGTRVNLDDDGGPIVTPPRTTTGGRGRSPEEQFRQAMQQQRQRMEMLQQETALLASLSPLVEDYGYAIEKLRAQQELENAATKAGLALTPERRAEIEALAHGYATATVEAAKLAEAQGMLVQSAEDLARAGRAALDTIIDGFLEGKDAGEIFNSVLKDLARNLAKIGLDLLGGGMKAGGFNPFGFLSGLFGFSSGTANTGGRRGEPRGIVHGQEAVIPLPAGGNIPVDIRMPAIAANPSAQAERELVVHVVSDDEKFTAYVEDGAGRVVARAAPAIVGASVGQANKSAPAAVASYQRQRAGGDWRNM